MMIVILCGCNSGVKITEPPVTAFQEASNSSLPAITDKHNIAELAQSHPYLVVGEGNLANEDSTRTAGLWYITAPEANDYAEYAQTAIQAVIDLYNFYRRDFTEVMLIVKPDVIISYATAFYPADGRGAEGMTGSAAAKPMYWKVRVLDDQPFSEKEITIAQLWQQKMADFPNPDILSSLS